MKQIIKEVLETEEKVGGILVEARSKASAILQSAEKDVAEKTTRAKEQSLELIKNTVAEAVEEAERIAAEKLLAADSEKDTLLKANAQATSLLVDNICRIVLAAEGGEK